MNVARLALGNIERFGEYVSLQYEGRSITNIEQQEYAARVAGVLRECGVEPGDRVMVMMPNSPDTLALLQAAWMIGAAAVPIAPQLKVPEVQYLFQSARPRLVVTIPLLASTLREAGVQRLLLFGSAPVDGAEDISRRLGAVQAVNDVVERAPDDMALLLYTSGTTAHPKGVIVTHQNLIAAVDSCTERYPNWPRCRFLQLLPWHHVYGILMLKLSVAWGVPSTLLPVLDVTKLFAAIQQYRIERMAVVPAILVYMLHFPERARYDTSSLTKILSGGAALPEPVRVQFEKDFHCEVVQGYGLSETASIATGYADDEPYRAGSSGRALAGVELQILDGEGRAVASGQSGEICIRGPVIMPGYWNDPDSSREALAGGWFHTGDIGYLDPDGYLYITDRKKDLIIKGGENISPREIEEVLHRHPAVAESAVIGIFDETFGENICAVVVLKPGAAATAEDLCGHAAQYLTRFKLPAQVIFQDALPKNLAGKVLKRELRRTLGKSGAAV